MSRIDTVVAAPADTITTPPPKPDGLVALRRLLKRFHDTMQHFTVPPDSSVILIGEKGTYIHVVPGDLQFKNGATPTHPVEVSLKELQGQADFLRNNAPTTSNGRLLESGGACFIAMSSDNKELQLKSGKTLKVEFPMLSAQNMELFYGKQDTLGTVNWKPLNVAFKPLNTEDSVEKLVSVPKYKDSILAEMDVRPGKRPRTIYMDKFHNLGRLAYKMIDGTLCLVARIPDTSRPTYTRIKVPATAGRSKPYYKALSLLQLGWYNCDRYNQQQTLPMYVDVPSNNRVAAVTVFVIFKSINSVTQKVVHFEDNQPGFLASLPKGNDVKIIAFGWKDGCAYAFSKELKIGGLSTINLNLRKVSSADIQQMITL